jgi:beta-N-acetylhexosaminidase
VTDANLLSRRSFVRGVATFAGALMLAACGPATTPLPSPAGSPNATGAPTTGAPPTATGGAPTTASPAAPAPSATAAGLSLRQKIARLLIVGFRGLTVDDAPWIQTAIAEHGLGGVILFDRDQTTGGARNVKTPAQVRQLTADLRKLATGRELIIGIDQEGGIVTRLSPKWGYPAVASQASIGEKSDDAIRAWATGIARTLADAGINYNFAPVVDVNVNPTNPAIGALDRSFSADAQTVAHDAAVAITAHRAAGVRTALKHFPGLGSATTNTDFGVADVTKTWTVTEIDPYGELLVAGLADSIMVGHIVNGQLDPNAPGSLSKDTVTLNLRTRLGWRGVVVTDDMGAAAITEAFGFEDAIGLALEAGNDLLLFANQQAYDAKLPSKVVDIIEGFVRSRRITEARIDESIARIDALFASP